MNSLVASVFITLAISGIVSLICSVFGFDWTKAMIVTIFIFVPMSPGEIRRIIQEENEKEAAIEVKGGCQNDQRD